MRPARNERPAAQVGHVGRMLRVVLRRLATCALAASPLAARAAPVLLYDGVLGTPPSEQGWAWLTDPPVLPRARYTTGADAVRLDSTPLIDEKAGWFANFPPLPRHPGLPALDRHAGYRVEWDLLVLAEDHASADRSGFSVIVLGDDLWGVELAFWTSEVWTQTDSPPFTHGEGATFETTRSRTRYALVVSSDRYQLLAEAVPLLQGPLRNYSAFGQPYDIPDFVFLGDDTSRGAAQAELARVEACAGDAAISPGGSLRIFRQGNDLRLEVADAGAAEHHVYRDASPRSAGTTLHVSGPLPVLLDTSSIPGGGTWYFVARSVDGCGFEHD